MLLAVDIGNTNTVIGVFTDGVQIAHWRVATDTHRMSDEHAVLFDGLFRIAGLNADIVDGAIIGSVVPAVQSACADAIRQQWSLDPVIVSSTLDSGIPVRYDPPHAVGADRIANAVAAVNRYGAPAIVVDFGTATTFDTISSDCAYIGGAIAPGLEISMAALFAQTAQLPHISLEIPPSAVGTTTVSSLQSGALYGYAGLVDGLVERIATELGGPVHVIATGGLSRTVSPYTRSIQHVDPDLTLFGLYLLYERNRAGYDLSSAGKDQSVTPNHR